VPHQLLQVGWHQPGRPALSKCPSQVRDCINQLPDDYRTILILRDIEELSTDETATRLGLSCVAVKIRLHRARQALRTLLEQSGVGAP
jgi:DNA-directed RNA polymerase specialized sigma24 family protein